MNVYLEKINLLSIIHIIKIFISKKINNVYFLSNDSLIFFSLFKLLNKFLKLNYSEIKIDHNELKINNESLYSYLYRDLIFHFYKYINKNK